MCVLTTPGTDVHWDETYESDSEMEMEMEMKRTNIWWVVLWFGHCWSLCAMVGKPRMDPVDQCSIMTVLRTRRTVLWGYGMKKIMKLVMWWIKWLAVKHYGYETSYSARLQPPFPLPDGTWVWGALKKYKLFDLCPHTYLFDPSRLMVFISQMIHNSWTNSRSRNYIVCGPWRLNGPFRKSVGDEISS